MAFLFVGNHLSTLLRECKASSDQPQGFMFWSEGCLVACFQNEDRGRSWLLFWSLLIQNNWPHLIWWPTTFLTHTHICSHTQHNHKHDSAEVFPSSIRTYSFIVSVKAGNLSEWGGMRVSFPSLLTSERIIKPLLPSVSPYPPTRVFWRFSRKLVISEKVMFRLHLD